MKILTTCDIILDLTDPEEKRFAEELKKRPELDYEWLGNDTVSFTIRSEFERSVKDYLA